MDQRHSAGSDARSNAPSFAVRATVVGTLAVACFFAGHRQVSAASPDAPSGIQGVTTHMLNVVRSFSIALGLAKQPHKESNIGGTSSPCLTECSETYDSCGSRNEGFFMQCCSIDDHCVEKSKKFAQCRPKDQKLPSSWKDAMIITTCSDEREHSGGTDAQTDAGSGITANARASDEYEPAIEAVEYSQAKGVPCKDGCGETWDSCGSDKQGYYLACCSDEDQCIQKNDVYTQCRPMSRGVPPSWAGATIITKCSGSPDKSCKQNADCVGKSGLKPCEKPVCRNGVCTTTERVCENTGQDFCKTSSCNPSTGNCETVSVNEGANCGKNRVCGAGKCKEADTTSKPTPGAATCALFP